jgi:hypothetical protein
MRTPRRLVLALVVVAVALCSTAATCSKGQSPPPTPRHQAVAALKAVTSSLVAVQASVKTFRALLPCESHPAPCITAADYQAFGAGMVKVWDLVRDAVLIVKALKPGDPIPIQVANLVAAIRTTLKDVLGHVALNAETQTTVFALYDDVAGLLLTFAPMLL